MRGITPVIAIILLLLMAVAAAGGFYFVYQGFTEEGEESGSTQIEQLGEQSLAQMSIESVAGGRIYVKNVGASDIDLSKATVYVENQPVDVNSSTDTLAERSRAVLKFTQAPSCPSDKCDVRISGAASTSKKVDLEKLSCSSNADCYAGETCEGGVCVEEGGEEAAVCGDGNCDAGEDGESCFADCGPRSLLLGVHDGTGQNCDVHEYLWNGTTYEKGENLTATPVMYMSPAVSFDSQGNALAVGTVGSFSNSDNLEIYASYNSSGSWSEFVNVTQNNDRIDMGLFGYFGFNSSNEAIATWVTGEYTKNLAWASFDGSSWSTPDNITDNSGEFSIGQSPNFAFSPSDTGMAVWESQSPSDDWLNYSYWDGSKWAETGTIVSLEGGLDHSIEFPRVKFNETHAMAVWEKDYDYLGTAPQEVVQWSVWDGSSWSSVENVTDERGNSFLMDLEVDGNGNWLLLVGNDSSTPYWTEWWSWENGWTYEGNLTASDPLGFPYGIAKNENGAVTAFLVPMEGSLTRFSFTTWDGTGWSEPAELEDYACIPM